MRLASFDTSGHKVSHCSWIYHLVSVVACYEDSFLQSLYHCQAETLISTKDTEMLINAFVISRADYCNLLFQGLSAHAVRKSQLTHYAAVRILFKMRLFECIALTIKLN